MTADTCQKSIVPAISLLFLHKKFEKIPKKSNKKLEVQSIYKPPPFRPNWSGHSSTPLLSTHTIHSTLLYPLLGTEEAQQCRKIASHYLSLELHIKGVFLVILLHLTISFLLVPFVLCPSLWETFPFAFVIVALV